MIIGSISENKDIEKRISITPEIAKKYINLGFQVQLIKNYGKHLGFEEKQYTDIGVKFVAEEKELIENSNIIIQMSLLNEESASLLKPNQTLIGILNPYENKIRLDELVKKKNKFIFSRIVAQNYKSTIYGHTFISSKFSWI